MQSERLFLDPPLYLHEFIFVPSKGLLTHDEFMEWQEAELNKLILRGKINKNMYHKAEVKVIEVEPVIIDFAHLKNGQFCKVIEVSSVNQQAYLNCVFLKTEGKIICLNHSGWSFGPMYPSGYMKCVVLPPGTKIELTILDATKE